MFNYYAMGFQERNLRRFSRVNEEQDQYWLKGSNRKNIDACNEFFRGTKPYYQTITCNEIKPPISDEDIQKSTSESALHYASIENQCDSVDNLVTEGVGVNFDYYFDYDFDYDLDFDFVDKNLSTPFHLTSEKTNDFHNVTPTKRAKKISTLLSIFKYVMKF